LLLHWDVGFISAFVCSIEVGVVSGVLHLWDLSITEGAFLFFPLTKGFIFVIACEKQREIKKWFLGICLGDWLNDISI